MTQEETGRELVLFADPMCSWCWGFAPELAALRARFGDRLPLRLVMGGLRAGEERRLMDDGLKVVLNTHWRHVQEASGQSFDFSFFEREGFVYDTEPACRAVVTMRHLAPENTLTYFERLQRAFYETGADITQAEVLAELAEDTGLTKRDFRRHFTSEAAQAETAQDFAMTRALGVQGFPTLIVGSSETGYLLVTDGYRKFEEIAGPLSQWLMTQEEATANEKKSCQDGR